MVDNLISKTLAWEDEKRKLFLYDGVSLSLFRFSVSFFFAELRCFDRFLVVRFVGKIGIYIGGLQNS